MFPHQPTDLLGVEEHKLLRVGVGLPIDADILLALRARRLSALHPLHEARRWWLLTPALNPAEVSIAAILEECPAENDALYGVPQAVPILEAIANLYPRW